ncbi:hypothetical protein LDENG_00044990 [Lucifuga dentata]|nr:hypothetical protein LDENG_00044990 [Lucifuga dentata]
MLRIMLIASKRAITRKWLKTEVPTVEDWVEVIHNMYTMEKLIFSSRLELDKFKRICKNWTECTLYRQLDQILYDRACISESPLVCHYRC